VAILSDAQVALKRAQTSAGGPGHGAAIGVISNSDNLTELLGTEITFRWVPGHTDITGNEAVDESPSRLPHRSTRKWRYSPRRSAAPYWRI